VSSRLYWGGRYYLLMSALRDVHVPVELSARRLARQEGWDCMTITLPEKSDNRIEQWCQREAGLPVIYPKALVEMLVPLSARKVNGEIQVYANDEIIVGLSRRGTEALEGKCYVEGKRGEAEVSLKQSDSVAIRVRTGPGDGRCFFVRFESEPGILIDVRVPTKAKPHPLRLKAISNNGDASYAPFGTLAAHRLLRLARSRGYKAVRLQTRTPCEGTLSWRKIGHADWSQDKFVWQGSDDGKYRSIMPRELAELLLRRDVEISVSLGSYGSLYAPTVRQKKLVETVRIPSRLAAFIATQAGPANSGGREFHGSLGVATPLLIHQRYASRTIER
jgi:hypothetical protein